MKFEGDLTKFFPPDLVLFLAKLEKEGLLTVANPPETVFVSLREGLIVDAQSKRADDKLLVTLLYNKVLDKAQYQHIRKAKSETGMPVRQILERLNLFPLQNVQEFFRSSIKEALFQLFLWEAGDFSFTDVALGADAGLAAFNPQAVVIEIAEWVDEWQQLGRELVSLDRIAIRNAASRNDTALTHSENVILQMARGNNSIDQIVRNSPLPSIAAGKAIYSLYRKQYVNLHPPERQPVENAKGSRSDTLFHDFKKTFKKIMRTTVLNDKVKCLTDFCEDHFDQTYIISASSSRLVHCIALYRDQNRNRRMKRVSNVSYAIAEDPVFSRVYHSRIAFFGKLFMTEITRGILPLPKTGECAVIPLGKRSGNATLLFVLAERQTSGLNAFHYLELLSSLVNPRMEEMPEQELHREGAAVPSAEARGTPETTGRPPDPQGRARDLARLIEDLPPMPHIAARVLEILSDPDSALSDVTELLSQDQSLMALIIKVSNSVLYRTDHFVSTLHDAVNRLGTKAVRSLVLTASTRSLFPKNNKQLEIVSHSLWQHSKECGLISRRVAEEAGYSDPEEAFIGGVLHDIGKLAMMQKFPQEYMMIKKMQAAENTSSIEAEKQILGFCHDELGALLMKKWNMPQELQACVRGHHAPGRAGEMELIVSITAVADYLSHVHGTETDSAMISQPAGIKALIRKIGLSAEDEVRLQQAVVEDLQHSDLLDE